jgi:hypothetical protein
MSKPIQAVCPQCEYEIDDASGLNDAVGSRPEPGDLALCINCSAPSFYVDKGETLGLRLPTSAETVRLFEDEDVQKVRRAIQTAVGMWAK